MEIRVAEGRTVRLDVKKSSMADFASAFIDYAVEHVRKAAAANRVENVEMLAEGFLAALNERVNYFLAHIEPAEKDLVLEWLTTGVVGGYAQDFLRRYVSLLAEQSAGEGPGKGPR
jgi:hypothetical protein